MQEEIRATDVFAHSIPQPPARRSKCFPQLKVPLLQPNNYGILEKTERSEVPTNMDKKKWMNYTATGLFAIQLLRLLPALLHSTLDLSTLLVCAGYLLLLIGSFRPRRILSACGAALLLLDECRTLFFISSFLLSAFEMSALAVLNALCILIPALSSGLLILAAFKPKKAKVIGIIAGATYLLPTLVRYHPLGPQMLLSVSVTTAALAMGCMCLHDNSITHPGRATIQTKRGGAMLFIETVDKFFAKILRTPILFAIVFAVYFTAFYLVSDSSLNGMYIMIALTVLLIIGYLILRKIVLKDPGTMVKFYQECVQLGLNDMSKSYQRQKAELVAQRMGCKYKNMTVFYARAKKLAEGASVRERQDTQSEHIKELCASELAKHEELTRFTGYSGRSKRIAILEYTQKSYRKQAAKKRDMAKFIHHQSQEREIPSGMAGGIASGLFGGVAGVAAYIDAENENAKIRERNKASSQAVFPFVRSDLGEAYEYERKADALQNDIEDAKIKVVADTDSKKLFSYLSVRAPSVEISETGAFTIKANIKVVNAPKSVRMIGDKPGVFDGVIAADMYQRGKKVGRALMALPTYGIRDSGSVEGIAICTAEQGIPYEIRYSAHSLWLMEE